MARPTTLSGSKVLLKISDGSSPLAFIAPCALTTKSNAFSASTNESIVPDCDDPDLPAWVERDVSSLSSTISGSGVLAMESLEEWQEFFTSGTARFVRFELSIAGASGGGYWQGEYILSSFSVSGERGNKAQVEIELVSDGEVAWTDAA